MVLPSNDKEFIVKPAKDKSYVVRTAGRRGLKDLVSFKRNGKELFNARLVAKDYCIDAENAFSAISMLSGNQKVFVRTGPTVRKLGLDPTEFNGGVDGGGDYFVTESGVFDMI